MRGYYNKPADTVAAFTADGFFRTGDAGRFDGGVDGFSIFIERLKELMKTSTSTAPQRVEGVPARIPCSSRLHEKYRHMIICRTPTCALAQMIMCLNGCLNMSLFAVVTHMDFKIHILLNWLQFLLYAVQLKLKSSLERYH